MKEQIQDVLNRQIDLNDRESAERKMNDCLNQLGNAAKYVSLCKGNLERKKALALHRSTELNSRLMKMEIDSKTIDEQEELELAEKLWSGLNKTIDGLKSLLSIQDKDVPGWK